MSRHKTGLGRSAEPAQQMQTRFLPQIRQKAGTLDAAQVMAIVRGG